MVSVQSSGFRSKGAADDAESDSPDAPTTSGYHVPMVYYEQKTPPEDQGGGSGCLDAVLITRALFGLLLWPLLGIAAVVIDLAALVVLFFIHPALALIPVAITVAGVWAYARWEQRHFRRPDA